MSVVFPINVDDRFEEATAAASQTVFAVPFPFQDDNDLEIRKIATDGTETILTIATDYTLSGAGEPSGGQVTLTAGAAEDEKIQIIGKAVLERLTSIAQAGKFASKPSDEEHDRHRIIQQEQAREIARSIRVPYGQPAPAELPQADPGKALVWKPDGTGFENGGIPTNINWTGDWAIATVYVALNPQDSARNQGSTYVCILGHTAAADNEPGVGASWQTYWELVASKGDKGDAGPAGDGSGDMLAAIYDPDGIAGDAFDADLQKDGAAKVVMTVEERAQLALVGSPGTKLINNTHSPYALLAEDRNKLILIDASAGDVTVDLLALETAGDGFDTAFKRVNGEDNVITIDGSGGELIDGAASITIDGDDDVVRVRSNVTFGWQVKSRAWSRKDAGVLGKFTFSVTTREMENPTTGGAQRDYYDDTLGGLTNGAVFEYFGFDANADESVCFWKVMPKGWDKGTIEARFHWTHFESGGPYQVRWEIEAFAMGNGVSIDGAFGADVGVHDVGGSPSTMYVSDWTDPMTVGGSPTEDTPICFRVYRDVSQQDNLPIDAELHMVELRYTRNAGTDD